MTKLHGSARGTKTHSFIFTRFTLLWRTPEASLKEWFHNKYNTDNMAYQNYH